MWVQGNVQAPGNAPIGTQPVQLQGKQQDLITSNLHGFYYEASYYGKVFKASVVGVTVPAIAAAVVGVFAITNPNGSGVNAEILSTTLAFKATATAVTFGWYQQNTVTNIPTSPTAIIPYNAIVGTTGGNSVIPYSALTAASATTPVLCDLLLGEQSTSALQQSMIEKIHDGRLILPPSYTIWLCSSAAGPTSGTAVEVTWAEWPV